MSPAPTTEDTSPAQEAKPAPSVLKDRRFKLSRYDLTIISSSFPRPNPSIFPEELATAVGQSLPRTLK